MARSWWSLHGLTVVCDGVEIDARHVEPDAATPDVEFTIGDVAPVLSSDESPTGRTISSFVVGPKAALTVVARDEGSADHRIEAHFHDLATATMDPRGTRVSLSFQDAADETLAAVLIPGTLISIVMALRGHPVLHASSVVVPTASGPQAIAFVGRSGMGKSTMATLLCRDGAEFLGDDVLRTDAVAGGAVSAWPGATASRLREGAETLGRTVSTRVTTTADGRLAAELPLTPNEPVPLLALVVPRPDRGSSRVHLERIRGAEALLTIASFPRILGWVDPTTTSQAHRHWGELARRVPLFVADVPWGPPFASGLGTQVIDGVIAATGASAR